MKYSVLVHSLFALVVCGCQAHVETQAQNPLTVQAPEASSAISALNRMRSAKMPARGFPDVGWGDVPALLAVADSTYPLVSFPTNPISSQSQSSCTEGVMALWMIESVRCSRPLGFPSLNPLLLGGEHVNVVDWCEISDRNQLPATEAYQAWWQRVRTLTEEDRRLDDPLANTAITWH